MFKKVTKEFIFNYQPHFHSNFHFQPHILRILLFALLLYACQTEKAEQQVAFYHWKTKFQVDSLEQSFLDSLAVQKLYLKFFDVDWNTTYQQTTPSASIVWDAAAWNAMEIVPTVFITNQTFKNITAEQIPQFAEQVQQKLKKLADSHTFQEIQIDCDWTQSTREQYFQFLSQLKAYFPRQTLSATIRLHQIKYPEQTGIPPVDRGMLMYYNTGEIGVWESENSIYEAATAVLYIDALEDYSLDLDVVLALFHWGLVFRDDDLFKIVNNLSEDQLTNTIRFRKIADNRYKVVSNTFLKGHYLYAGDLIRLERIQPKDVQDMAAQLSNRLSKTSRTLAFYHLDATVLKNWAVADLKTALRQFDD
ncbi:MAG: hypothetical protein AAGI49_01000 [Bacteroidota bacterium]